MCLAWKGFYRETPVTHVCGMLGHEAKHSRSLMDGLASLVEAAYAAAALCSQLYESLTCPLPHRTLQSTALYVFEMEGVGG